MITKLQNNILMIDINENSRKIVFASQRRQKFGNDGNVSTWIRMRHDFSKCLNVSHVAESWKHLLLCVPLSCLLLRYAPLQSSLQPSHQAVRADGAEWISLSRSGLTPLRVSFWVGLCCIVIKASKVLQSSPVAQLVLVLLTKNHMRSQN